MQITILDNHSQRLGIQQQQNQRCLILGVHSFTHILLEFAHNKKISILLQSRNVQSLLNNIVWNQFFTATLLKDLYRFLSCQNSHENSFFKVNGRTYKLKDVIDWEDKHKIYEQIQRCKNCCIQSFQRDGSIRVIELSISSSNHVGELYDIVFDYSCPEQSTAKNSRSKSINKTNINTNKNKKSSKLVKSIQNCPFNATKSVAQFSDKKHNNSTNKYQSQKKTQKRNILNDIIITNNNKIKTNKNINNTPKQNYDQNYCNNDRISINTYDNPINVKTKYKSKTIPLKQNNAELNLNKIISLASSQQDQFNNDILLFDYQRQYFLEQQQQQQQSQFQENTRNSNNFIYKNSSIKNNTFTKNKQNSKDNSKKSLNKVSNNTLKRFQYTSNDCTMKSTADTHKGLAYNKQAVLQHLLAQSQIKVKQHKQLLDLQQQHYIQQISKIKSGHEQQIVQIKEEIQPILNQYRTKNKSLKKQNICITQVNVGLYAANQKMQKRCNQLQDITNKQKQTVKQLEITKDQYFHKIQELNCKVQGLQEQLKYRLQTYQEDISKKQHETAQYKSKYQRIMKNLQKMAMNADQVMEDSSNNKVLSHKENILF